MNKKIDYIIDLRSIDVDQDDAAIMAAEFNIIYVLGKNKDIEVFLKDWPENITAIFFVTSDIKYDDIISILALRYDLTVSNFATLHEGKLHNIKNISINKLLLEFLIDKNNLKNDLYGQNKLSEYASKFKGCYFDNGLKLFIYKTMTAMENLSYHELSLFCGESFLKNKEIHSARFDTYIDSLKWKELSELVTFYLRNISNGTIPNNVKKLMTKRRLEITSLLDSLFDSSGNMSMFSGFPVVYKYIAAYFITCAYYKNYYSMYSSSFLYGFRSLDLICDGLMIMEKSGIIETFGSRKNDFSIVDRNSGNNIKATGFTQKWNVLKGGKILSKISERKLNFISDFVKVRNKHMLTHGTLKINNTYCSDFLIFLEDFYNDLDKAINAKGFTFFDVKNLLSDIFKLDYSHFLFESICDEFEFSIIKK